MESNVHFLLDIAIILFGAMLGGIISKKLKQPAVLGQIVVGIVLGAGIIERTEFINHMSEIGVVLLMFIAGLETDVHELQASSRYSAMIALGGVIAPMLLVGGAAYMITNNLISSIFLGVISTATSVSISVQTLKELGHLRSRQGIGILGAAIIDDVVGIILLTMLIGIAKPTAGAGLFVVVFKIVLFFALAIGIGYLVVKTMKKMSSKINIGNKVVTYAMIGCFVLAFISEELGVAAITGAYFAGVICSMTQYGHKISHDIQQIAYSLFIPIFFVGIGLGVDLGLLGKGLAFGILMLFLGIVAKIVGCGFGAKMTGFNNQHALQIGIGMIPRAEVAIIITNLGVRMNFLGQAELASVILLVLGTTLITPSMLKWAFREEPSLGEVRLKTSDLGV